MPFMDLPDRKDLIIDKTILEILQLECLCNNFLCYTLSKAFEISKISVDYCNTIILKTINSKDERHAMNDGLMKAHE